MSLSPHAHGHSILPSVSKPFESNHSWPVARFRSYTLLMCGRSGVFSAAANGGGVYSTCWPGRGRETVWSSGLAGPTSPLDWSR